MALIGTWTTDDDFEAHVSGANVSLTSAETTKRDNLVKSVEGWIQAETGREFLSQSYDLILDGGFRSIMLPERPISDPPSTVETVDSWDTSGLPDDTTAITRDKYLIRGRMLLNLAGKWPAGQIHVVSTAGYSASDLLAWSGKEPQMLKILTLGIIQREWKLEFRHVSSHSFGDESDSYLFTLDGYQRMLLGKLTLD